VVETSLSPLAGPAKHLGRADARRRAFQSPGLEVRVKMAKG
jgi:hypothetical protein